MAARDLKIEAAFATLPLPGQTESGDLCLIKRVGKGTLLAVVDGLGHGQEAASAAHAAVGALDRYSREPLIELVRRGYFREEGIDLDYVNFGSASEIVPAVATNQLEVGGISPNPATLNALSRGLGIKLVGDRGVFRPGFRPRDGGQPDCSRETRARRYVRRAPGPGP